jgi:hypothetical protein
MLKIKLHNKVHIVMPLTAGLNCWLIQDDDNECVSWGSLFVLPCVDNKGTETVALCHIHTYSGAITMSIDGNVFHSLYKQSHPVAAIVAFEN